MPENWNTKIALLDKDGNPTIEKWVPYVEISNKKDLLDLVKSHAGEAMHGYRYFGALRGAISWVPAVIVITLITYVSRQINHTDLFVNIILGILLVIGLGIIFIVQVYIQDLQLRSRIVAERANELYIKIIEGNTIEPMTFHSLLDNAKQDLRSGRCCLNRKIINNKWDITTIYFFWFFITLIATYILFVIYSYKH